MKTIAIASILSFAAAFAFTPIAGAQDKPGAEQPKTIPGEDEPGPTSESDFVSKALQRGTAEVKVLELAASKTQTPAVKEIARELVREHTNSNQELKKIADKLDIRPAETPNAKAEEKLRELSSKTGKEFDAAFIKMMLHCHATNVSFYEAGKKVAKNSEVTAYIDKALPVLKSHSEKIEAVKAKIESVKSGDTTPKPGPDTDPAAPEKR
jgi:putative membrane protein